MEQTYKRTLMLKCYFNKVTICSLSTRVLSLKFAAYFSYNMFLSKLGSALLLLFLPCLLLFSCVEDRIFSYKLYVLNQMHYENP